MGARKTASRGRSFGFGRVLANFEEDLVRKDEIEAIGETYNDEGVLSTRVGYRQISTE